MLAHVPGPVWLSGDGATQSPATKAPTHSVKDSHEGALALAFFRGQVEQGSLPTRSWSQA